MRSLFGDRDISPAVLAAALGVYTEPPDAAFEPNCLQDLDSLKRRVAFLEELNYVLREVVRAVRLEQRAHSGFTDGMIMRWRRRFGGNYEAEAKAKWI